MNLGYFNYPMPVNEPVLNDAANSAEKIRLKEVLAELKKEEIIYFVVLFYTVKLSTIII